MRKSSSAERAGERNVRFVRAEHAHPQGYRVAPPPSESVELKSCTKDGAFCGHSQHYVSYRVLQEIKDVLNEERLQQQDTGEDVTYYGALKTGKHVFFSRLLHFKASTAFRTTGDLTQV